MSTKERRELIGELQGFFPGENENEKAGNAIEKALLIGMAYGFAHVHKDSGVTARVAAASAAYNVGIGARYRDAILEILEGK